MNRRIFLLLLGILLLATFAAYPRIKRHLTNLYNKRLATQLLAATSQQLREGDLIFHTSRSAQSQAIQLATHSPYSHCGILYRQGNTWQVYEAVQPVSSTTLVKWIARGQDGHFVVKRLRDANRVLTPNALQRLKKAGEQYLGRNYDLYFGWTNDRIYCSELLWKMYKQALGREIGSLQTLRDFDLSHPAVQQKMRERYGNRMPLDEKVISPVQMFNSPELVTVVAR